MSNLLFQPKIPVTIITGFLGSGKTTLIQQLLTRLAENNDPRHFALIINEFGEIGVDGEVLMSCGVDNCVAENIIELANGCLCCTVAEDFIPTMNALLAHQRPPDHIIVETSGLALPKPLVKAFDWPEIRNRLTVDGVITLVDACALLNGQFDQVAASDQRETTGVIDHDNPMREVFEDQLLCADLVVVNKIDLVAVDDLQKISTEINLQQRNLARQPLFAARGIVDPVVLLGLAARAEDDLDQRPSHHEQEGEHDHDDFESFECPVPKLRKIASFMSSLATISKAHQILRLKGFLEVEDGEMRMLVQGVGGRLSYHFAGPWKEHPDGRLVIIGQKGLQQVEIVEAIQRAAQAV